MDTTATKITEPISLAPQIWASLKAKAEAEHSSLSNYIESLLLRLGMEEDELVPNATTIAAMKEAEKDNLEILDLDKLHEHLKTL